MSDHSSNMRKSWNIISPAYQQRYEIGTDNVHYGPLCPTEDELSLLGDVSRKRIIEIGSGAAQNSIFLAKHGAICTALDISDKQLEHGRVLADQEGVKIDFVRGAFIEIDSIFEDSTFDQALSVYALQYCYDLSELERVVKSISRILKLGSSLVFSVDHPMRAHGYWNEEDEFVADDYFDRKIKTWGYEFPEVGVNPDMSCNHKTVSDYVNAVIKAGMNVVSVLEPEPVLVDNNTRFGVKSRYGINSRVDPYSFNHLSRIPGTLLVKAVKE